MDYSVNETPEAVVIVLTGRFTFTDASRFKQSLDQIKDARGRQLTLDLSGVDFIDSAAMGMLLLARDTANSEGVRLVLRAPSGQVKRILEVAKFSTLFEMVDA